MPALVVTTAFVQQTFDPRRHRGSRPRDWSIPGVGGSWHNRGWEIGGILDVVTPISSLQRMFAEQHVGPQVTWVFVIHSAI